ncbi:MAG: tetratricopeptide repeat protein, partial [Terriglobia bacterium]
AGVALMHRRKFAEAETKFRNALDINPTYGIALFNLGLVLAAQGEFNSAITEFRKALVQEPINPKIHLDLARALEMDGNSAGAIGEFQLTLRLRPGYPGAQQALEQALKNQRTALNAGDCVRARLQPCRPKANKMAALQVGEKTAGVPLGARASRPPVLKVQDLRARGPRSQEGQRPSLGECEKTVKAVTDLHAPLSPASLRRAAVCAFGLNDFSRAIPLLAKAAKLNPRDEDMRILLARAYAGVGRHERAIETLKAWTKARGEDGDALYWTGKFYDELANQTFQQMAEKYPHNYLVYETEGNQLTTKQQFPQALASYQKALALAPKDTPGLHFHVGDIYWRTLRYLKAENELQQELRINPYHAKANYELGAIYAKEGNPQKAVALLDKAIALDPTLVEAHRSLGQAYLDERQYNLALDQFLVVAKAKPSDYTIRNMLATTYRMLGRLADARRETSESQKLYMQYTRNFQATMAGEQKLPK